MVSYTGDIHVSNMEILPSLRHGDLSINKHVHCSKKGSRMDAGIALAHLYAANEETFRFFKAENVPEVIGYAYIGSVTL